MASKIDPTTPPHDLHFARVGPGRYVFEDWEVRYDASRREVYRVLHRGRDRGGAGSVSRAVEKAVRMFDTSAQVRLATYG